MHFLRPDSAIWTNLGFLGALWAIRTKFDNFRKCLLWSEHIGANFGNFIWTYCPKFWKFSSGLVTYNQGSWGQPPPIKKIYLPQAIIAFAGPPCYFSFLSISVYLLMFLKGSCWSSINLFKKMVPCCLRLHSQLQWKTRRWWWWNKAWRWGCTLEGWIGFD